MILLRSFVSTFIFLHFFLCGLDLRAQHVFQNLDVEDGLSQNSIVSISQDTLGYLWIATQDGLNKYDGRFKIYPLQFDDITRQDYSILGQIYVTPDNEIWAVTKGGRLFQYDILDDTFVSTEGLSDVRQIKMLSDDQYLIRSGLNKLTLWDGTKTLDSMIVAVDYVHGLTKIEGRLWVLTNDGVWILNNDLSLDHQILSDMDINAVAKDGDVLWIGTYRDGVYLYQLGSGELTPYTSIPSDVTVMDIVVSEDESVWIATYGQGAYVIEPNGELRQYTPKNNLSGAISYHDVLDLYQDLDHTIWLGTDGGGLDRYDRYNHKFHFSTNATIDNAADIEVVRSIYVDSSNIFIGTSGRGLAVYDRTTHTYSSYTLQDGLSSNRIVSIYGENDVIWLGTQGAGINTLRCTSSGCAPIRSDLDGYTIWKIRPDRRSDHIWLGTREHGLLLYHPHKGRVVTSLLINADDGAPLSIRDMAYLDNRRMVIATEEGGLWIYDLDKDKALAIPDGPDRIKSIGIYNDEIYVGTDGSGLWVYDDTLNWSVVSATSTGLANDVVYGIQGITDSTLWVSTNRGISRVHTISKKVENFTTRDGLQYYEFNTGASFEEQNGTIYFGGIKGYNWFHPDNLPTHHIPPRPILQELQSNGDAYPISTEPIYLSPEQNSFSIKYASMQLSRPEGSQYRYRLLGYDSQWHPTSETHVPYMNMSAGRYTFELMAANYDGVWSPRIVRQDIVIKEHWYLTLWTKLIVVALLSYIGYLLVSTRRKRRLALDRLREEELRGQMLQQMSDFRTKMISQIIHELRTPLTVINGMVSQSQLPEQDRNIILRNSKGLLGLVNQLLDLNKIKSGQSPIQKEPMDMVLFVKQVVETFQPLAIEKNMKLQYINLVDQLYLMADRQLIKSILSNLIANAIKYGPKHGTIGVCLQATAEQYIIEVIDKGNGIAPEAQEKVFEWFYRSDKNHQEDGSGLGLAIVKEMTEAMNGEIHLDSSERGSTFSVIFPLESIDPPLEKGIVTTAEQQLLRSKVESSDRPSILLIEDNKDLVTYMSGVLSDRYELHIARDGRAGIQVALSVIPDIIITDIMMPIMDGNAVITEIRSKRGTSHIPIIVLTAYTAIDSKLSTIKRGATAYLAKPFLAEELLVHIETILSNRDKSQAYYRVAERAGHIPAPELSFLQIIQDNIKKNIDKEAYGVQDLCDAVHLGRTQVYRKVKALTGLTPTELIRHTRMDHAWHLLKTGNDHIADVAYQCGYKEPSYFSKVFKKHFGCVPSDMVK